MLRRSKHVQWERLLPPEDVVYLKQRVEAEAWYPMATFERFGVAILENVEGATLEAVRLWGRFSASVYATEHIELIAPREPMETLMRLRVLRGTLFDFPAFDIPMLIDNQALVSMSYQMGPVAEEAACVQTMGFCEGILALAGAPAVRAEFDTRSWLGAPQTRMNLEWEPVLSARR
jgi:hypothetical protein